MQINTILQQQMTQILGKDTQETHKQKKKRICQMQAKYLLNTDPYLQITRMQNLILHHKVVNTGHYHQLHATHTHLQRY